MRTKCNDCAVKHLCQVLVLYEEFPNYPDNQWRIIGHLAEAASECELGGIAEEIRRIRIKFNKGGGIDDNYIISLIYSILGLTPKSESDNQQLTIKQILKMDLGSNP